ncbi:unnamed protein product [Prorocentrum cordatum]|uniref:Uncharacterized protein n=1 Tax=Prorocentrum cordatum TaxID=2364126 RepID=A0ABN9YAX7_9DINO|nr:unnamed protein product [Polarella glacialis]
MALKSKPPPRAPRPGDVVAVGHAKFDMDGRTFTPGEMDRLMMDSAVSKYPCARPATFDEYTDQAIVGLPRKNEASARSCFCAQAALVASYTTRARSGARSAPCPLERR